MADIILHIKDSYYFDVPKKLWESNRANINELPEWLVRLDDDYQSVEADKIIDGLSSLGVDHENLDSLKANWIAWKHSDPIHHTHAGWPLDAYLESEVARINAVGKEWAARSVETELSGKKGTVKNAPGAKEPGKAYLAANSDSEPLAWFHELVSSPQGNMRWQQIKESVDAPAFLNQYKSSPAGHWSSDKMAFYNKSLHGKILIPQPFGELKNAYESASGFCISKYMIIQVVVALVLIVVLRWLAKKIVTGHAPKGKLWNALEGLLIFVRDKAITPVMGVHEAERFTPLLLTFFVFIFGLNLAGMIPWLGSPTASLSTTSVFALIVFGLGVFLGIKTFGAMGFLKNICPELGLPWYLAFWAVPMLWVIEFASLFIKHAILALRLLANMVAGHAVLLGIMGLAVGVHAIAMHPGVWYPLAGASAIGMTALSLLELLVAFIQATVFTFLAALFIGSSMHHH